MAAGSNPKFSRWIAAIARDLQTNKGASIVIAGDQQPPAVHALAHAMNAALGNVGKTVFYTDPIEANPVDQLASLQELVERSRCRRGGAAADPGRQSGLQRAGGVERRRAYQKGETAHASQPLRRRDFGSLPVASCPNRILSNAWGDGRAYDGTVTLQQPLIEPLYGGRAANEILAMFTDVPLRGSMEIVKGYWAGQHKGRRFRILVAPSRCTTA